MKLNGKISSGMTWAIAQRLWQVSPLTQPLDQSHRAQVARCRAPQTFCWFTRRTAEPAHLDNLSRFVG
jgi:hypothetical protein